jgi:hypothetical protein
MNLELSLMRNIFPEKYNPFGADTDLYRTTVGYRHTVIEI